MKKTGFTLIEILVATAILGIVAVVGVNMFFSILRGSTKTRVLAEVKQNGNYALNVMERTIRNAKSLESHSEASIEILNPDDESITFSCDDNKIKMNGENLISDKVEVLNCAGFFTVVEGEEGVRPAEVTIDFRLKQAGTAARPEEQASVDFKTTVTLRNY